MTITSTVIDAVVASRARYVDSRVSASASQAPPMFTTSIEVHTLASRAGLPCPCGALSRVEVDLVLADAETLAVIGRYVASECQSCGADEVTR